MAKFRAERKEFERLEKIRLEKKRLATEEAARVAERKRAAEEAKAFMNRGTPMPVNIASLTPAQIKAQEQRRVKNRTPN